MCSRVAGSRPIGRPVKSAHLCGLSHPPRRARRPPPPPPDRHAPPPRAAAACPTEAAATACPHHPLGARASAVATSRPATCPGEAAHRPRREVAAHPSPASTWRRQPAPHSPHPNPAAGTPPMVTPTRRHCPRRHRDRQRHRLTGPAPHRRRPRHPGRPQDRPAGHTDPGCPNRRASQPRPPRRRHGRPTWCQPRHRGTRLAVARHR